jgi:hypothetical protein
MSTTRQPGIFRQAAVKARDHHLNALGLDARLVTLPGSDTPVKVLVLNDDPSAELADRGLARMAINRLIHVVIYAVLGSGLGFGIGCAAFLFCL